MGIMNRQADTPSNIACSFCNSGCQTSTHNAAIGPAGKRASARARRGPVACQLARLPAWCFYGGIRYYGLRGLDDVPDLEIIFVWVHHVFFWDDFSSSGSIWSKWQRSKYMEQLEGYGSDLI